MTTRTRATARPRACCKSYPNLKAIIAPTTVGIVAAAQAVTDAGLIGKINVTGLGLPSEFKQFIDNRRHRRPSRSGTRSTSATRPSMLAHDLAVKKDEAKPGAKISIGRVGKVTLDDTNSAAMAPPFQSTTSRTSKSSPRSIDLRTLHPPSGGGEPAFGQRRRAAVRMVTPSPCTRIDMLTTAQPAHSVREPRPMTR